MRQWKQLGSGDKTAIILGLIVVVPIIALGGLMWQFNRPPFDLGKLHELSPGMSQNDVRRLLGKPNCADNHSWHYSRAFAWPIVHIYFDHSGKFQSSDYD